MKRQLTIVLLLLTGLLANGQMASHTPTVAPPAASANASVPASGVPFHVQDKPVARVNGAVLTDRDLLREMYSIFPYARQHNGGFPKSMEAQIRQGAMGMIVFEELVYQQALRSKTIITAARMKSAETDFQKQFSSPQEFQQFLQAEFGGSAQKFHDKLRRSLLIQQYLKTEVESRSVVTDAELRAYYEKNPARFSHPESFAIQSISILPPGNANPDVLKEAAKRAEDVYRQAKATKSYQEFGLLAEKASDDDFHVNMGDHKLVDRAQLPPEIVKLALSMKIGDVSEMMHVGNNFTFFRLNAHVPAGKDKLEDGKAKLRSDLQKAKYERLRAELDNRLKKSAKVEIL